MAMHFFLREATEAYASLVPGALTPPLATLWIKPSDNRFDGETIQILREAFLPLRCALWYADNVGSNDPAVSERRHLLVHQTSYLVVETPPMKTVHSFVGWVSSEKTSLLANFLDYNPLLGQGLIVLLPDKQNAILQWSKIVQGPLWLWMCRDGIANAPQPSLQAGAVTLSYLAMTAEIGGCASLLWVDSNIETGLTFFGSWQTLSGVTDRLYSHPAFVEDNDLLARLISTGFAFDVCK